MISRLATDGVIDEKSNGTWTIFVDNRSADLYETEDGKTMLMVHGRKPIEIKTEATINATAQYEAKMRDEKYKRSHANQGEDPRVLASQPSKEKPNKGHQKHSKGFDKNMKAAALKAALENSR